DPRQLVLMVAWAHAAAVVTGLMGVLVLLAWQFDQTWFASMGQPVAMNPLTALCFVLAALALYLKRPVAFPGHGLALSPRAARRLGTALGIGVAVIAGSTIFDEMLPLPA